MSKESGLAITTFSIDDSGGVLRAVINDIVSFGIATPRALQDVTGLDKSAMERLILMADATITGAYVFNDAATTSIFAVLKNFATIFAGQVGRTLTIVFSGDTLTNEVLFDDFPLTRAASGELTGSFTGHLSDGTLPAWS